MPSDGRKIEPEDPPEEDLACDGVALEDVRVSVARLITCAPHLPARVPDRPDVRLHHGRRPHDPASVGPERRQLEFGFREGLRRESARTGRTMSELVEAALRLLLQARPGPADLPVLPSFTSEGALVDIADREALYRAMEGR